MLMPPFVLHRPTSVEEACKIAAELAAADRPFDWVAGGTDLLPNYKWHLNPKGDVISLAHVDGADALEANRVGCMVRLHDVATSDVVHPLLAAAAAKVASSLIRRSATIGGNLCLDTRCFWYNQSEDWRRSIEWCHKADCGTGADCRVIPNQNTLCVATYQGDMAAAFMALGAEVELVGPSGERRMALEDFFELDGMKKNVLQPGEFLLAVHLSDDASSRVGAYHKLRVRETWDFPEAGIAASWIPGDASSLRVASTGLESIPGLHTDLAQSHDDWTETEGRKRLSKALQKAIKPVNNTALPPRYRRSMVSVLASRALRAITQED
ncbi:MAG: FAD binding domain-containing protein [Candidatus Poseidoniaceae archaeon]